jgi:cell division protein FtsA
MAKQQPIVGLDIGTTKVAVCVGQVQEGIINVIGTGLAPNSGLRKGMVVDIEDTVSAISAALEEAERMSGLALNSAYVGIGGAHLSSTNSHGVIAVSRADGEISEADINRVLEAARAVAMPPNREILHVIPQTYTVDGQEGIKDPLGMTGIRLEVEAHVIGGATSAIKNLSKCVGQAGLDINNMIFSALATSKTLLGKKQKEIGVCLVDLGAGTCSIAIFEEGDVLHCNILPIGSMHITNDIAIGLRTNIEVAEKIKLKYGTCLVDKTRETETIDLADIDPQEEQKVSRRYVAEIIEARMNETFTMLRDELRSIGKDGMLPAGIIFTGGGSKLEGVVDLAKDQLRLPAQIGYPIMEIAGMVDKLDDPIYAQSIGLMLWGMELGQVKSYNSTSLSKVSGSWGKIIRFFKQFIP